MTIANTDRFVTSEITIHAPASKIFAALTDPAQLPQWWGEEGGYQVERMEADLRAGGRWRVTGRGSDGKEFSVEGVYRAVDPPHVLEYTWNYSWDSNASETVVRIDLTERNGSTLVRVKHSGFVDDQARDDHEKGWVRVLGWLSKFVE
jgi:glutathione S-transferase